MEGQPAVELRLTDGPHHATVTEQHPASQDAAPTQAWSTSPSSATYRTARLTITYRSDLPAGQADDALPILKHVADAAAEGVAAAVPEPTAGESAEPLESRLERGINKIAALFTP